MGVQAAPVVQPARPPSPSLRAPPVAVSRRRARKQQAKMAVSKRVANAKSSQFHGNVHKRNAVPDSLKSKKEYGVGPVVIGFFLFVVVGSALLQIISTAT